MMDARQWFKLDDDVELGVVPGEMYGSWPATCQLFLQVPSRAARRENFELLHSDVFPDLDFAILCFGGDLGRVRGALAGVGARLLNSSRKRAVSVARTGWRRGKAVKFFTEASRLGRWHCRFAAIERPVRASRSHPSSCIILDPLSDYPTREL